jgi:hypothetical protein
MSAAYRCVSTRLQYGCSTRVGCMTSPRAWRVCTLSLDVSHWSTLRQRGALEALAKRRLAYSRRR